MNLTHLCFFSEKNHISTTGGPELPIFALLYQSPMILMGSMSKFAIEGPPGAKFKDLTHLGPFLRVSLEK